MNVWSLLNLWTLWRKTNACWLNECTKCLMVHLMYFWNQCLLSTQTSGQEATCTSWSKTDLIRTNLIIMLIRPTHFFLRKFDEVAQSRLHLDLVFCYKIVFGLVLWQYSSRPIVYRQPRYRPRLRICMQASSDMYTQTRCSLYEIAVEIISYAYLLNDVYRYRYSVS